MHITLCRILTAIKLSMLAPLKSLLKAMSSLLITIPTFPHIYQAREYQLLI